MVYHCLGFPHHDCMSPFAHFGPTMHVCCRRDQAWGRLQIDDYEYDYKQFLKGDYDYTKLKVVLTSFKSPFLGKTV